MEKERHYTLLHCSFQRFVSHLIASEALGQHPEVNVIGDTGEGVVGDFRGAPLRDAFRYSIGVGTVGE